MKYIFIINEKSGNGKSKKILPKIEDACNKKGYEYEIRYITEKLGGAEIAKEYANKENIIYVVGGDGTITRTLSGIVGTKNKLAVIPSGSGNDTYRSISKLKEKETLIDLGKINDEFFINVACTGLDAEVANNIDTLRNTVIPSKHLYNASILYSFIKYKFREVKFKTKIKEIEGKYSIISISNGGYYGGGYNIAPKSLLTDGVFDIYYAERMPKIAMIPLILKLRKGKHEGKRKVHKFRTDHVELELKENITFNVDGEKMTGKKFVLDIIPKAITIYNDKEFVNSILE